MSIALQRPLPGMDGLVKHDEPTTMQMIADVIRAANGDSTQLAQMADVVKVLVELRQSEERFTWEREERQAHIDFDEALNRVQDRVGWVAKDVERSDGKGSYASFEGLDKVLRPEYTREGFAVSCDADPHPPQGQQIVIIYLSRAGQKRTYHLPVIIDANGPKGNPVMTMTDAANAAHSKGCRILLGRIFNIATGDKQTGLSPQDAEFLDALVKQMKNSENITDCKEAYGKAYKRAREIGNNDATIKIIDVFESCRDEFQKKVAK